jgi:hypothetical protein
MIETTPTGLRVDLQCSNCRRLATDFPLSGLTLIGTAYRYSAAFLRSRSAGTPPTSLVNGNLALSTAGGMLTFTLDFSDWNFQ